MKESSDECHRLDYEIVQLKLDLWQSKHNEEELEKKIVILRDDLVTANEYKEKFKISWDKLDVLLESQKKVDDKKGLRFEKGESSGSGLSNPKSKNQKNKPKRSPIRQPNAQRYPSLDDNFFVCNKFGHKAIQCKSRMNLNGPCFPGQCFNCNKYGH